MKFVKLTENNKDADKSAPSVCKNTKTCLHAVSDNQRVTGLMSDATSNSQTKMRLIITPKSAAAYIFLDY